MAYDQLKAVLGDLLCGDGSAALTNELLKAHDQM